MLKSLIIILALAYSAFHS